MSAEAGWVYYGKHYGGVESERGRDGVAWGRGVCQCGWRGEWRRGEQAGFTASADHDVHYSLNASGEEMP